MRNTISERIVYLQKKRKQIQTQLQKETNPDNRVELRLEEIDIVSRLDELHNVYTLSSTAKIFTTLTNE